jgi:hypothetical protein
MIIKKETKDYGIFRKTKNGKCIQINWGGWQNRDYEYGHFVIGTYTKKRAEWILKGIRNGVYDRVFLSKGIPTKNTEWKAFRLIKVFEETDL